MKKRIFATLLALTLALGLTATAWADDPETFVGTDGNPQAFPASYTEITETNKPTTWNDGWYVVRGNVIIEPSTTISVEANHTAVNVTGDHVNLILCDGAKLMVNQTYPGDASAGCFAAGIHLNRNLYIYGQSEGTGQLVVNANVDLGIAILSNSGQLTVNGGSVTAKGYTVGIYNNESNLTINGGKVTATGQDGIYNLGSQNPDYGKMTINGGTVTAIGTRYGILNSHCYGRTTINSGTVIASGTSSGLYNINSASMNLPTTDYWWRTAADGAYAKFVDDTTAYTPGSETYAEITTTDPVPPAPEPEPTPEPEPSAPAHEPIRRQHVAAVEDTTDTADTTKADEAKTDTVTSAKTFDAGVAVYGAMAVASLLGMGYVGKKRV